MKKKYYIIAVCLLAVGTITAATSNASKGSSDYKGSDAGGSGQKGWWSAPADIQTAQDEQYLTECGSCHFAYQPGLLPQASWARIMGSLEDHFGDDASLDTQQTDEIRTFLMNYAADVSKSSRSKAFAAGALPDGALPRITETRYFRREHSEIPDRLVKGNPDVGSFSNCQSCHRGADQGVYDEHQINIPGVGRWED